MALGEPVLPEAANLAEHPLGELGGDALGRHPADEPVVVALDAPAAPPRRHVAPQLVGLAGGVVGRDHRELHHLLLEQRHPQRLREHRLEARVGVGHRLLAVAPPQVRVHHAAGDGPRPDDGHLDDEVVVASRPEPRQHRHLRPALDLEDADGVAAADHVVGGLVPFRNRGHRQGAAVVPRQQPERQVELGQRPQPQQVDLEQPEVLQVVLVPLNDGASGHRRVLDRHQVVHRLVAQQEAAGVDGQVAGKVPDLAGEPHEVRRRLALAVEHLPHRVPVDGIVVGQPPGEPVDRGLGQPQRLPHLAHGRAGAVADDVGDHRRPVAPVLLVDELNHLFPPLVHDVEVDVGRLGPLARQEALEQQIDPRGVDGGDAEAVADGRVGGRPPPLAEDAVAAAELDDLPHGEEVAAVVELVDEGQLLRNLRPHRGGDAAPEAPPRPRLGEPAEPARRGVAVGEALGRVAVADLGEREAAPVRNLDRARHRAGVVAEQLGEGGRRLQAMLGVGADAAPRPGEAGTVPDAGQHVLEVPPRRVVVEHLRRRRQGQTYLLGPRPQPPFPRGLGGEAVAGQQPAGPIAEGVAKRGQGRAVAVGVGLGRPVGAGPEGQQPGGVPADLVHGDAALALGVPASAAGDEPAEVGVAGAIGGQQHQLRPARQRQLGPAHQVHAELAGPHVGAHDAVHAIPVGQREAGQAQGVGLLDQLLGMGGAFQKRVVALAPERRVRLHLGSFPPGSCHLGPGSHPAHATAARALIDTVLIRSGQFDCGFASPPPLGPVPGRLSGHRGHRLAVA